MTRDEIRTACAVAFIAAVAFTGFYFDAASHSPTRNSLSNGQRHEAVQQGDLSAPAAQSQRNNGADERTSANNSEPDALSYATIGQWVSTGVGLAIAWLVYRVYDRQRAIMAEQAALLGRQVDNERPWMFVAGFGITRRDPPPAPNAWLINISWKNVGRMPAIIDGCVIKFGDITKLPQQPDYSGAASMTVERTAAANYEFKTGDVGPAYNPAQASIAPVIQYVAYGKITYHELSGRMHETGFAVQVAPHFIATNGYDNAAYEYWN